MSGPLQAWGRTAERLVLWIVVDQLPESLLAENLPRLPEGGFRRLEAQGLRYTEARYRHAITFTACGHATLFTGRHPAEHGVVANEWADRATGQEIACVEDPRCSLLGGETNRPHQGASPQNLLCPTIGDRLVESTGGRGRVFSVSFKDRGAILPGGHRGKAFWYSSRTGHFVSSSYYYPHLPAWADRWNQQSPVERYRGKRWELVKERGSYRQTEDDRPFEQRFKRLGRTFPHPLDADSPQDLYATIPFTPMGDELTLDFVKNLVEEEKLGKGAAPDLLAISFSSTDQVGHMFGPDSVEAEDNLFRLDRLLAELLGWIDQRVGLAQTLVILTSDHGMDYIPESLHAVTCRDKAATGGWVPRGPEQVFLKKALPDGTWLQCCTVGRHDVDAYREMANEKLSRRYGVNTNWIAAFYAPWLFLNEQVIRAHGLKVSEVEQELAEVLAALPGLTAVLTRSDFISNRLPRNSLFEALRRSFHPDRAGNVLLVPAPHWYLYTRTHEYAATHGSPHDYDRHVPLLVAGPGLKARSVARPVYLDALANAVAPRLGLSGFPCEKASRLHEIAD